MRTFGFSHWSEGRQVQGTKVNVKYQLMETWLQNSVLLTNFANCRQSNQLSAKHTYKRN